MSDFHDLLLSYNPDNVEEKDFKTKMLCLLDQKGQLAFSRDSEEAHFTASAWLMDKYKNQILLLKHSKLNKWLQPGGHADSETDLQLVARKEASEETNIMEFLPLVKGIFDLDIHLIPERKEVKAHYHYDVRYAFIVEDIEKTLINNESKAFKWLELNEVSKVTENASILRMVRKTSELLNKK